jgi:hypothetical protein
MPGMKRISDDEFNILNFILKLSNNYVTLRNAILHNL